MCSWATKCGPLSRSTSALLRWSHWVLAYFSDQLVEGLCLLAVSYVVAVLADAINSRIFRFITPTFLMMVWRERGKWVVHLAPGAVKVLRSYPGRGNVLSKRRMGEFVISEFALAVLWMDRNARVPAEGIELVTPLIGTEKFLKRFGITDVREVRLGVVARGIRAISNLLTYNTLPGRKDARDMRVFIPWTWVEEHRELLFRLAQRRPMYTLLQPEEP